MTFLGVTGENQTPSQLRANSNLQREEDRHLAADNSNRIQIAGGIANAQPEPFFVAHLMRLMNLLSGGAAGGEARRRWR
jgi:hypothetical protein